MIRPSHTPKRFVAQKVFTDREDAMRRLVMALDGPQEVHAYRVLVFYGVGGQGKTALKREFERMIEGRARRGREAGDARRLGWAAIDFDSPWHRTIDQALLAIRLQLAEHAGIAFPAFDTAFARYFALDNPGADMRKRHPEMFRGENELLNDLIDFAEGTVEVGSTVAGALLPGANLLYKYTVRLSWRLKKWWDKRGKSVLAGLDELKAHELLEKLPTYLGADLCDALTAERPPRLAILIDTYEALWRDRSLKAGTEALRADAWVRLLVQDAPGVLVALFGRDRLRWGEVDPGWDQVVKQHLLGGLSDSDADLFLRRVPIEDASVCARIVTAAEGLPFYLDLAADTYERIVNQSGTPAAEDFGASRPEILARFLDHLEREEVEVLKLTAHARLLDEPLLLHLCERFLGGAATCDFGRLADYSFMTPQVDGRLVMHALMREELQRRDRAERPELFKRIHEVLFDWHDAKATIEHPRDITSSHEASLKEAAYHLPFFDLMRFPRWIGERGKRFFDGARYELIAPLYQRAVEIGETALGPAGSEMAVCTANLAELCRRQGRYAEAEQLFRRAVELGEKAWGPEHPALAEILNNLGLLQWNRGYYAEAEPLLARTLVVREKSLGPEHPDVSESLNDLSLVYRSQGRYGEAELLRQRALAIREKVLGPEHPEVAESLNSLAGLYRLQGRHAEAEALYQRALVISEQALGPEHPVVATRLNNLAGLYRNQGRHAEAEPLYERAIAIGEKPGSGDPLVTAVGHPRV